MSAGGGRPRSGGPGAPRPSRSAARRPPAIAPAINAPTASAPIFPTISASTMRRASASTAPPLNEPVEIFGEPVAELEIESDKPQAHLAVRLCDVAPDGASLRAHLWPAQSQPSRQRRERPRRWCPASATRSAFPLCATAHSFAAGPSHSTRHLQRLLAHRLALAGKGDADATWRLRAVCCCRCANPIALSTKVSRLLVNRKGRRRHPSSRPGRGARRNRRTGWKRKWARAGRPSSAIAIAAPGRRRIRMSNTTSPAILKFSIRPAIR